MTNSFSFWSGWIALNLVLLCLFRCRSVFRLLVEREISPKTKFVPRKRWGESRRDADSSCGTSGEPVSELGHNLISWYLAFIASSFLQAPFIEKQMHFPWRWVYVILTPPFGLWLQTTFLMCRVEAESLHHLSAKYCPLVPPPRSTIAAAFSSDGRTLASTQ